MTINTMSNKKKGHGYMKLKCITKSIISVFAFTALAMGIEVRSTPTVVDEIHPGSTSPFKTWYYPYGYVTVRTINAKGQTISTRKIPDGPQYKTIGTDAGYMMRIYSKNDPRTTNFNKPVLVTEGFDPAYNMADRMTFDKMERICNDVYDLDGKKTTEPGLVTTLYNEDYDLIILQFVNPNTSIETNANVLIEAIKWIEAHTTKVDGNELVVIGPSMGGLVCRYALQKAGQTAGSPTYGRTDGLHVRMLIEFDSPNRGANVPMSSQGFLDFFSSEDENAAGMKNNLNSNAAQQMLLETVASTRAKYDAFYNKLNDPTFRQAIRNLTNYGTSCPCPTGCPVTPIRIIAVGNGSADGIGHDYLSNFEYAKTKIGAPGLWGLEVKMKTLEANTKVDCFYGKVSQFKGSDNWLVWVFATPAAISWESHSLAVSYKSAIFAENAPGGQNPVFSDIYESSLDVLKWDEDENEYNWWFHKQDGYPDNGKNCFIPTPSAAGIIEPYFNVGSNSHFYQAWPRVIEGAMTMFDRVYLPERNQDHVQITTENKEWILNEIRGSGLKCQVLVGFASAAGTGREDVGQIIVPVRLNYPAYQTVTVGFSITDATASPGSDYTIEPVSGTLVFNVGQTAPVSELKISVVNDNQVESDEHITVTLKDPVNAELGAGTVYIYTIEDNDQDNINPSITIAAPTVAETYEATSAVVTIGGTAADNVGVTSVTYTVAGATTGAGTAIGIGNWSIPNLAINPGTTTVTVVALDAVGNASSDQIEITYAPSRLYVDGPYVQNYMDGVSGSGTSWSEAYGTIQEALDFAETLNPLESNPIEIWVADGTYYPTKEIISGDARSKTFRLVGYVSIYGHFQGNSRSGGGETNLSQRIMTNSGYQSIASGDIGVAGTGTDNAYHVFTAFEGIYLPKEFVLDGMTITQGNCDNVHFPPYPRGDMGGGFHCDILGNQRVTISNCMFTGNSGYEGAALAATGCQEIVITNTVVENNTSNGSAFYIGDNVKLANITGTTFRQNNGYWGAALNLDNMSGVIKTNRGYVVDGCRFIENISTGIGGALQTAISVATAQGNRITRSIFYGNRAAQAGGAIFTIGGNTYSDRSLLTIDNCVFSQNTATTGGALMNGMGEDGTTQPALQVLSCSFNRNSATSTVVGGGAICNNPVAATSCRPVIGNSILWGELAGGEIYNAPTAVPSISYCDIQGGATGSSVLNIDPKFMDAGNPLGSQGLRLQTTPSVSPCVNTGNNALLPGWATTDVTGTTARILNSIVDLGAYENALP